MKKVTNFLMCILFCICMVSIQGCSFFKKVEAGYVGVRVNLLGSEKGIESEVLGVGRYFVGINQELYLFPVFKQTVAWQGNQNNSYQRQPKTAGAFQFQSKEGLSMSADVSMSFTVQRDKVSILFDEYRKDINEITNVYLYNMVRDMMVQAASTRTAESLYGEGKNSFVQEVISLVKNKMEPVGINIDYIAIIGNVWLPDNVKQAIDEKVKAGQLAIQRETEVAVAKAEAEKEYAVAEGKARSKKAIADANAYALLTEARAQQEANRILSESLTHDLIQYNTIIKWDGKLPSMMTGNAVPMISIPQE